MNCTQCEDLLSQPTSTGFWMKPPSVSLGEHLAECEASLEWPWDARLDGAIERLDEDQRNVVFPSIVPLVIWTGSFTTRRSTRGGIA